MDVDKELHLWRNALTALVRGEQCVLLVVVASDGSSPGRAGFKALVTSEGALFGSIGGGSMEHKLVELAKVRMTQISGGSPEERRNPAATDPAHVRSSARDPAEVLMSEAEAFPFLKRQVHRADEPTDRSGMICSGEQTVVFFHLDQTVLPLLKHITGHLVNGRSVAVQLGPTGMRTDDIPGPSEHLAFQRNSDTDWTFSERLGVEQRMVILGAGHVGLALSRTMNQLGFHVHLMDDRADLNTMDANQWAQKRSVVEYETIGHIISDDPELYVVLVSFGYRTDDILVRQLIRKRFKYLGMMGSVEKIKTLMDGLRKDGFTEEEIDRVRAPIGVPIGSKTPEEIAVSIAAEIIGVKNSTAFRDSIPAGGRDDSPE
ncbi:MAG: XdhC family protein [Flavobacteriales bacterium]|nr:XdhC family protein [Flavobacteriales bacterium]